MKVTEDVFYSLQGEGVTTGVPAVFIRFGMCMFNCSWCDTVEVWQKYEKFTESELLDLMRDKGILPALAMGAHLIFTGGEPLLQQKSIPSFVKLLEVAIDTEVYVEVETAGVIEPTQTMLERVDQWNISPKLANSGMPKEKRFNREVLTKLREVNSYLKFPTVDESEIKEISYVTAKAGYDRNKVFLMPVCDTQKEHEEKSKTIAYLCKKYGYRFSPRLQLFLWDQATGV